MTPPTWPVPTVPARFVAARMDPPADPDGRLLDTGRLRIPPSAECWVARPASEWLLHSRLELGAIKGAVPSARRHVRHILREWGLAELSDSAELVASELTTNAVQASRGVAHSIVQLWLASDGVQVVICVWDASPQPPIRMEADGDAEHGRGLLLVEAVSKEWGWSSAEHGGPRADPHPGKTVWAVVS
jgi:anti-sigma regulatory factor (Ser/Thr protein kinase)